MTARYDQIHDSTVRDAFELYCHQRVDTTDEPVLYDPSAATADAEWTKHNLSLVRDSLPNGYCGRPPQQDCPHPSACLTCPDFQTTPEFLDVHRQHAARTESSSPAPNAKRALPARRRATMMWTRVAPSGPGPRPHPPNETNHRSH